MVEFRTLNYSPMDRGYHQAIQDIPVERPSVEEPIIPISELGTTVPEHDPAGRFKNIVQSIQAEIRKGAGTLQLIMMTPPDSPMGGRPKAYGKEVRQAIREVALANQVAIKGVEMPTAMNNLSGFDHQNLVFSDEKRARDIREIKDAIKFVAETTQGGGIDIVSWEFPRQINDAPWNKGEFEQVGEQPIGWLVDERNGRTSQFRKEEILHLPYDPKNFDPDNPKMLPIDPETNKPQLRPWTWQDFVNIAKKTKRDAEKLYLDLQIDSQIKSLDGWATHYADLAEDHRRQAEERIPKMIEDLKRASQQDGVDRSKEIKELEKQRNFHLRRYEDQLNAAAGQLQQAKELEERKKHSKVVRDYAFERSVDSYAKAGIAALETTQEFTQGKNPKLSRDIYVGPEIGWPGYFGSHPQEFVDLIKKSRERMAKALTSPYEIAPDGTQTNRPNPYYRPGLSKREAEELAKRHIKGLFDTSHFGMWLAHFKPKPGETEEQRIQRFNKWYKKQVEWIAKQDVVGSIQLVDSASAAHGHLPPGQGIFPVKEAAKIFKKHGFRGYMVSEGHEEEKFGEGRILTKAWQEFGAPAGRGYFTGAPVSWGQIQQGYMGRTYSPLFMFGAYAPSNEFKLWSEVPFE